MSRIWKALKQAQDDRRKHEGRSSGSPAKDALGAPAALDPEAPVHANSDGADRRRSQRWEQPVPVLVYGSDSEKQPFHEETETAVINDDGCSFMIATSVAKGQRLFLVNMWNDAELECRVVQASRRSRGRSHVAVEFSAAAPDFWLPRSS